MPNLGLNIIASKGVINYVYKWVLVRFNLVAVMDRIVQEICPIHYRNLSGVFHLQRKRRRG